MTNIATGYVALRADVDDLKRDLGKAQTELEKATGRMQGQATRTGQSFKAMWLAYAAGAAVVAATAMKAIKAASDLQETTSKFNVVFKGQQKLAESWSKALVTGYAMSTRESKAYLSSVQDLLVPMGMAADEAGRMSFEVVKLAADLGSFNNLPTEQVMLDIQSALVGNYETMKKYGVVLNATIVQQKALEMGLAKTKAELTAADKAQAAYTLTVAGSQAAIGDMERTSDSYANTVKQAEAAWEDFMASLGDLILPVATKVVSGISSIIKELNRLLDTMDDVMLAEDPFGGSIGQRSSGGEYIDLWQKMTGSGGGAAADDAASAQIINMKDVMAETKAMRDDETEDIYGALDARYNYESDYYDQTKELREQEHMETVGRLEEIIRANQEAAEESTKFWTEHYQNQMRATQMWGTFFLSALSQIRTKSLPIQLGILAIQTGIQFAMAVASAHAAANLAMATIPPPAGEVVAAARLAWGMHNAYMILAQAGGTAVGMGISAAMGGQTSISGGTAGGGGPSGIGPAAPLEGGEQQGQVNIYIEGDMLADELYLEMLAEKISEAVEGSEVRLIASEVRAT